MKKLKTSFLNDGKALKIKLAWFKSLQENKLEKEAQHAVMSIDRGKISQQVLTIEGEKEKIENALKSFDGALEKYNKDIDKQFPIKGNERQKQINKTMRKSSKLSATSEIK